MYFIVIVILGSLTILHSFTKLNLFGLNYRNKVGKVHGSDIKRKYYFFENETEKNNIFGGFIFMSQCALKE